VRQYKDIPISEEDIREILEAAVMAPSASNMQPWYFVAISNKEKLAMVTETMTKAAEILVPYLEDRFGDHPQVVAETKQFIGLLGHAPLCVLAFLYKDDETYKKKETELVESTAAAIQTMLLAAYDKGISSCWLTAPLDSGMDAVLREQFAPDKGKMVAMLTFGYSDQKPRMPKRKEGRYTIIA
jgi:nitroreductase